jgi:hypothetical protein
MSAQHFLAKASEADSHPIMEAIAPIVKIRQIATLFMATPLFRAGPYNVE